MSQIWASLGHKFSLKIDLISSPGKLNLFTAAFAKITYHAAISSFKIPKIHEKDISFKDQDASHIKDCQGYTKEYYIDFLMALCFCLE